MKTYNKVRNVTSVAELRANLSTHLSLVKAGGEVLVTDRGTPVARLVPVEDMIARGARMQELTRAGLVREAERQLDPQFLKGPRPVDSCSRGLEMIREERAEGP